MSDPQRPSSLLSPEMTRLVEGILDGDLECIAEMRRLLAEDPLPRPFCGQWPYSVSDLDTVLPEANDRVHKARGCCDGWLPYPDASGSKGADQ